MFSVHGHGVHGMFLTDSCILSPFSHTSNKIFKFNSYSFVLKQISMRFNHVSSKFYLQALCPCCVHCMFQVEHDKLSDKQKYFLSETEGLWTSTTQY